MAQFECQNLGCSSGGVFEVGESEEAAIIAKGWTWPPRNCPSCREWKRSQVDSTIECTLCGFGRIVSADQKRMQHKNVGPWVMPSLCRRCETDPQRANRLQRRKEGRHAFGKAAPAARPEQVRADIARQSRDLLAEALARKGIQDGLTRVTPVSIPSSVDSYMNRRDGDGNTRYHHVITRHGRALAEALNIPIPDDVIPVWAAEQILLHLTTIAEMESPMRIAEFVQPNDPAIIKLDKETGVMVVIRPDGVDGNPQTVTSLPLDPGQAAGKVRYGKWDPLI